MLTNKNKPVLKVGLPAATVLFILLLIGAVSAVPPHIDAAVHGIGDAIPGISCSNNMTATVYAEGLTSPDGLAFDTAGLLHVTEETAGGATDGKITQIASNGAKTVLMSGLSYPEGIAFDADNNLYFVQDTIGDGSLIKRTPAGVITVLHDDLNSPEGVAIGAGGTIYVTASDAEKAVDDNPSPADLADIGNYKTYLYSINPTGPFTSTTLLAIPTEPQIDLFAQTAIIDQPSFSGITIGLDGKIYVASESSGISDSRVVMVPNPLFPIQQIEVTVNVTSTRSVFVVDPLSPPSDPSKAPSPFVEGSIAPEGLRFQSAEGTGFPLLIVEKSSAGSNSGKLISADINGNTTELCTGFNAIEDVIVDSEGNIYVTEDSDGQIVKLTLPVVIIPEDPPKHWIYLPLIVR